MRAEDCVGQSGRTLTDVADSGTVEVAGEPFEAMTVGPPIAAGETVEVTGWRLVDSTRRVLSVRALPPNTGPAASSAPRVRTAEERLDQLERLSESQWRPGAPPGGFGWLLLTFGQIVSIICCVATPIYTTITLNQVAEARAMVPSAPDPSAWIILGAVLVFGYSAAMAVVFSRVKQVRPPK